MNEKQVIKKLTLLKNIQPTQTVLEDMKKGIYRQARVENKGHAAFMPGEFVVNLFALLKLYRFVFPGAVLALLIIVFLSVLLPSQLHELILYSKLELASNQYERAGIALADTTNRFGSDEAPGKYSVKEMSQSVALANTELSKLKLKGEKGKYTEQQCLRVYQEYLSYLEKENLRISTENKQSFSALKLQMGIYEELAEKKLHMYDKL